MGNIEKFYENTRNALPHKNIKEFIKIQNKPGKAIDLGCGAGRDTIFLIKNNWNVVAIDREEESKKIIQEMLSFEELKRFNFACQNFENIKLEKNNLVVSNFSIPFCDKISFNEFWNKIVESISINRIFCRKFLWTKRFMGKYKKKYGISNKRGDNRFIKQV